MLISIDTGNKWEMTKEGHETFFAFLTDHLNGLKADFPDLYLPTFTSETKLPDVFITTLYPGSEKFKNRSLHCSFVKKILMTTQGYTHDLFSEITRNGEICIQHDLPKNEWSAFTKKLMMFFWEEKWLLLDDHFYSLEDIIIRAIGSENYVRPKLMIATNLSFDGYGWGHSKKEINFLGSLPLLTHYYSLANRYDPNDLNEYLLLGSEVGKILKDDPYGSAGIFKPSSEIYISNAWGPADLVELLVHEYGHVFHGETGENIIWDESAKTLVVKSDTVQVESVAESFAWMVLRNAYHTYPEIKFFHIAKLWAFMKWRPNDPHLLGAAVVSRIFHSEKEGSFDDLKEYASALDFPAYLKSHDFSGMLNDLGKWPKSTIPVHFEDL